MSGVQEAALELGIVANMDSKLPLSDTTKQIDCKPPLKENGRLSSTNVMTDDGQLQWVKAWQRVEVGVICVVIAVVWGLLSLPVIFYHLPSDDGNNISPASGLQSCSVYNGTVCAEPLQSLQNCLPDKQLNSSEVHVSPNKPQAIVEEEAQLILTTGLGIVKPTPACTAAIVPFLCLNLFKLCDSNGTSYLPSSSECADLRSETCAETWDMANRLLVSISLDPLPICESLPETSVSCEASSASGDTSGYPDGSISSNSSIQCTRHCRDGFYCVDGLNICKPRCDEWEMYSHSTVVAYDIAVILSAIANLIAGTFVLVISCIRRKKMFTFPFVLVVYMTITLAVLGVFLLVQYVDRPSLYCSSIDLEESVDNSTIFCNIIGSVFYYAVMQITMWWFFHVITLFWKIQFPFHARSFENTHGFKYLHITAFFLGVVIPAIPVVIMLATGGFVARRFPPVVCSARKLDVTFYSVILPIIMMVEIGISLLIIMGWKIYAHKNRGVLKTKHVESKKRSYIKLGTAERKMLIVICYYILFAVISITAFTLDTRDSGRALEEITKYYLCESTAPDTPCDTSNYRKFVRPELTAMSFVLLGLFPAVLLIFVVNVKGVKQWCSSCSVPSHSSTPTTRNTLRQSRHSIQ